LSYFACISLDKAARNDMFVLFFNKAAPGLFLSNGGQQVG